METKLGFKSLGTGGATKQMNFRKSSKRPLTPPPHFRKVMIFQFQAQKAVFKGPKSET